MSDAERYNLANPFYKAVGDEPAGKAIVLASNGYTDTSRAGAQSCCGTIRTGAPGCSRMAACATSMSLRATTSRPAIRVRSLCDAERTIDDLTTEWVAAMRLRSRAETPFRCGIP
jgi:hypothetical protein